MRNITPKPGNFYIKLPDGSRGPLIATQYTRVVHGQRGPYVEFESVLPEFEVEPGQEYRFTDKWIKLVFYTWYRSKVGHRKLYHQYKTVNYADYLVGYYYMSPNNLIHDLPQLYTEIS